MARRSFSFPQVAIVRDSLPKSSCGLQRMARTGALKVETSTVHSTDDPVERTVQCPHMQNQDCSRHESVQHI